MTLGIPIVALFILVLGMVFPLLRAFMRKLSTPLQTALFMLWNVLTIGVSFEILESTTKHGEVAGPLELSAYLVAYWMASLVGLQIVVAVRKALGLPTESMHPQLGDEPEPQPQNAA
jgi:hypothetical protein